MPRPGSITTDYYRARYYEPNIGRFMSEDPIGFMSGVDLYVYVLNRAPNATDPSGLKIRVCNRAGWENLGGFFNHAYLLDTRNGNNCGRGTNSGKENPSSPGTFCVDVPDSDGKEDEVMSCCQKNPKPGQVLATAICVYSPTGYLDTETE